MVFRCCSGCNRILPLDYFLLGEFVCNSCIKPSFDGGILWESPLGSPIGSPLRSPIQVLPVWRATPGSPTVISTVTTSSPTPVVVNSVTVKLIQAGEKDATEAVIVRDSTAEQLIAYLRGILQATPVSINGLPIHAPTLCDKLSSGQIYEVIVEKPAPTPDLPVTPFPATGTKFDVVVLGGGPGGEAAAVLASQLGARVAVLEKRSVFGGPTGLTSKAVRHAIKTILTTAATLGGEKDTIQSKLWDGFPALLSGAQLGQAKETRGRLEQNRAQLIVIDDVKISAGGTRVTIRRGEDTSILHTQYIIIATGSRPARPASIPFTADKVVDAAEVALVLAKQLPKSIGILGGGVVGVEYALVLASVGVQATVFTSQELFMRMLPEVLRTEILATLKESNIQIVMDSVTKVIPGTPCTIVAGEKQYNSDVILYSMGRDANSEDLGLEDIGVKLGKYGRIVVNDNFQTTVPNVFAIGDVVGGRLASEASKAGRSVAKYIFQGIKDEDSPQLFAEKIEDVPLCLWTVPEMASVGATVEGLRAKGLLPAEEGGPIVIGMARYDNLVQGRLAGGVGFVQVIAKYDAAAQTHTIIGAQIFGAYANDLIQLAALLIHSKSTLELMTNTPWAAVTMSVLLLHAADDALFKSPYFKPAGK